MWGGRLRTARRACLAAAGVCLVMAFTTSPAPAQEDDTVPRPEVFRGSASSQVASVQLDRDALLPVPDLFRFIALDGASSYESSTRQARASLLFPGNGLILGPSLACGTFGAQFPAEFKPILDTCLQYKYPLTVFADDFEPDGASSGSVALGAPTDPISGNAVRAEAHAGEDATTTDAAMQDLRVLGLPAFGPVALPIPGLTLDTSLLTIDSAVSRTDQRIVNGVLVTDAEATLSGVRMIGGLIRIASLHSTSHVTDDAKGGRTAVPTLEMAGVTVGGIPAQITQDGLVLSSPDGASGPLVQQVQSQLNELLRSLDIRVTMLDSEHATDEKEGAVASVGGLLVEFKRDVQGLPTIPGPLGELDPNGLYTGSIQLASTAVRGAAFTFDPDAFVEDVTGTLGSDVGYDSGTSSFDAGSFGVAAPTAAVAQPSAPTAPSAPEQEAQLVRYLGGLFGNRLGLLYLSLMFATLGSCIAPAFAVPARFAGRHP
jgi:hypothetical protein